MGNERITSPESNRLSFEFFFNGRSVTAFEGDSIASALVRAGIRVFSRSMKFHRPRGIYCGQGKCYSCAMRVNGIPGVRTCSTRAEKGMTVETERGFPSTRFDALSILDHVFRKQLEYNTRFIRPSFMVPMYQKTVRRLASSSRLPDAPQSSHPLELVDADVLIVGHGISGAEASARLRSKGFRPLVADAKGTDLDPPSVAFGFYDEGIVGVSTDTGGMLVKPKATLLATGRCETGISLVNADLPGVVLSAGVDHLVRCGVKPGSRAVLVGGNENRDRVIAQLASVGTEIVDHCLDPAEICSVVGGNKVSGIRLRTHRGAAKTTACDLVVLFGPLVPEVALAQQAGCELVSKDQFWHVKIDSGNRTSVSGVFASGGIVGLAKENERKSSGARAAQSIIEFLEAE